MYKYVLQSIEGVAVFPLISLLIFMSFFIGLLVWVFRKDKTYTTHMAELPLDDQPFQNGVNS